MAIGQRPIAEAARPKVQPALDLEAGPVLLLRVRLGGQEHPRRGIGFHG